MAQLDTLAVDTTLNLEGVTVTGARIINRADRKLVTPIRAQVRNSNNGYDLLQKMALPGIRVDETQQKISSALGGNVQVRINDIKANTEDILSLQPDEVVRVEYIDNPGMRYSDDNLDAVINYIVRRRYSGYVGGLSALQGITNGFNNSNAFFNYNHKKSEFSINYSLNYRKYKKQHSDFSETYIYPDGTSRHREEQGFYNTFAYNIHNLRLGYNLATPDKSTLNIRLNLNWLNQPYYGGRRRVIEDGHDDLFLNNRNSSNSVTPSIDLYYSLNMPHKQSLALNVVGTYIDTNQKYNLREYLFNQSPEQSELTEPLNDYSYSSDGKKYSLISEVVYSKTMDKIALSAGAEYTISHTDNLYWGSVNTNTVLNSDNVYAFTQIQGKLRWLNYQAGVGLNYVSIRQGDVGFNKWTFRPQLTLSTNVIKNISIRYSARISQRTPSLSDLSEVRQQSSDLKAEDGNSRLQPYTTYRNSLSLSWNHRLFDMQVQGIWNYYPDVIMTTIMAEQQADGSYIFLWKPENQKSFSSYYATANMTIHAIKDVLDLTAEAYYGYYKSRGKTYSHNFHSWQYGLTANLMLGRWTMSYSFWPPAKSLWGETISGGERGSQLTVSYKHKNLTLGMGCMLLGYAQGFDYTSSTNSKHYKANGTSYMKDNGNMVYVTLSYNFSHGRKYNAEQRKLSNSDNDSGVR